MTLCYLHNRLNVSMNEQYCIKREEAEKATNKSSGHADWDPFSNSWCARFEKGRIKHIRENASFHKYK